MRKRCYLERPRLVRGATCCVVAVPGGESREVVGVRAFCRRQLACVGSGSFGIRLSSLGLAVPSEAWDFSSLSDAPVAQVLPAAFPSLPQVPLFTAPLSFVLS